MKARTLGPLLMVVFGSLMVAGALANPIDAGIATTTSTTEPCTLPAGAVDPCSTTTTDPCAPMVGLVDPCATTTTLDPCNPQPAIVAQPCETTTTFAPSTTMGPGLEPATTTEPGGVLPGGEENPSSTTAPATQPAVNGGQLARTGRDDTPLVLAGIALILGGAGLFIAGRRHRLIER